MAQKTAAGGAMHKKSGFKLKSRFELKFRCQPRKNDKLCHLNLIKMDPDFMTSRGEQIIAGDIRHAAALFVIKQRR